MLIIYRNSKEKRRANELLALKSLRSQMNPHFIFNALNSVNSFISKNDERSANKFLSEFSKLMRMVLENSHEDFVSLTQELAVIQLYVKLEHYRFRDKFDYTYNLDDTIDAEHYDIPPMLIQPFIENAVWHGLRYKEEFGKMSVDIYEENRCIIVEIKDDGIGRAKSKNLKTKNQNQQSKGLKNTEERLKLINKLYKKNYHLSISDLDTGPPDPGTHVKLLLPLGK
jgi:LytS/YehU family sensor histidine kinase